MRRPFGRASRREETKLGAAGAGGRAGCPAGSAAGEIASEACPIDCSSRQRRGGPHPLARSRPPPTSSTLPGRVAGATPLRWRCVAPSSSWAQPAQTCRRRAACDSGSWLSSACNVSEWSLVQILGMLFPSASARSAGEAARECAAVCTNRLQACARGPLDATRSCRKRELDPRVGPKPTWSRSVRSGAVDRNTESMRAGEGSTCERC